MPDAGRFRLTAWSLLLALAAALLLALFAHATASGLSGTGDSRYYLFAAQSLRETGRLLHPDGTAYRYWAPLYPLLLAALGSSLPALRALHAACLVGGLLLWSAVGRQLLPPRRAAAVPLLLACSTAALVPGKFVWAETVLGLLWAAYVWALLRWWRSGHWRAFVLSAGLGFLVPLQHSTGLFLLAGGGAALLISPAAGQPRRRVRLLHLLLSLSGALLWQWWVWALPGPEGAYENRGWEQVLSSLADYGFLLLRWLLPLAAAWRPALPAAGWVAVLVGLLIGLWPGARPKDAALAPESCPRGHPAHAAGARQLLWVVLAAYLLLLLLSTALTRSAAGLHDGERYLAALYPAVVLLALGRWPTAASAVARRLGPRAWRWLSWAALLAWLAYAGGRTLRNARQLHQLPPAAWLPPQP